MAKIISYLSSLQDENTALEFNRVNQYIHFYITKEGSIVESVSLHIDDVKELISDLKILTQNG